LRRHPVASFFFRHPRLTLVLLILPPILWLGVVNLGSIGSLVVQSFYRLDDFTGIVVREFTLDTWRQLFTPANLDIIRRTVAMAVCVTLATAVLGFPVAYYMARLATPRVRAFLTLAVLLPLWSSYLVRVYAWKLILAREGVVSWLFNQAGLTWLLDGILEMPLIGGPSLSVSWIGIFLAFTYVWLPYMILPIEAALEKVPESLLEASSDLGARPRETFRRVVLPLAFPGIVAGSIFTFSLTLGDFVVPGVLGNSSLYIGQAVLAHQGTAGNIPLAAVFTVIPMGIMGVYLMLARRAGAFEAL